MGGHSNSSPTAAAAAHVAGDAGWQWSSPPSLRAGRPPEARCRSERGMDFIAAPLFLIMGRCRLRSRRRRRRGGGGGGRRRRRPFSQPSHLLLGPLHFPLPSLAPLIIDALRLTAPPGAKRYRISRRVHSSTAQYLASSDYSALPEGPIHTKERSLRGLNSPRLGMGPPLPPSGCPAPNAANSSRKIGSI